MTKRNVLSLFDGISGMQLSLKKAGIKIDNYYASEVEDSAIKITMKNFPNTIQLGDVRNITRRDLPKIWMISAGSPCQNFSMAGNRKGMVTKENIEVTTLKQYLKLKKEKFEFEGQSYLFWEFIRLLKELKPKYFLLENVKMSPKWAYVISRETGVVPYKINSSLLTAQNRERWYWTNFPDVTIPKDKNVLLSDVIPGAITGGGIRGQIKGKKYERVLTFRKDRKANCIVTENGNTALILMKNLKKRNLTLPEAEILQTLPKNYTKVKGLSDSKRYKGIGNGWTIDVIVHLLKPIKKYLVKSK